MKFSRIVYFLFLPVLTPLTSLKVQGASPRYLELADSADYYIESKLWNKAEEKIVEALRLEPANFHNSLLLSNLGIVQSEKGEFEKALSSFSLGLSIAPSSTVLLNNRAGLLLTMGQEQEANADIDKSLSIDSIQEWPLRTKGLLLMQAGRMDEARVILERLKKHFPQNPVAYSALATIRLRHGDLDGAIEYYQKSVELSPEDEDTLCAYISLLIEKGDYTQSRALLKEAIERNPENPMFYLLRGYILRLNYRPDEAAADKKTAIAKGLDADYVKRFIP